MKAPLCDGRREAQPFIPHPSSLIPSSQMTERTYAGTLTREHAHAPITLLGWVQKRRDFGDLIFVDLRDRSGICQVIVDRDRGSSDEAVNTAKELRSEFVVRIEGTLHLRDE